MLQGLARATRRWPAGAAAGAQRLSGWASADARDAASSDEGSADATGAAASAAEAAELSERLVDAVSDALHLLGAPQQHRACWERCSGPRAEEHRLWLRMHALHAASPSSHGSPRAAPPRRSSTCPASAGRPPR